MLRKRLENGLDVVIQESKFSKMFAIQCWIGVGSLSEERGEEGISHCIEHMLFKGTRNYAVGEISRRIEFLGGEMNAYTSFEHTVFYITLPAAHAEEAVAILHEAIFYSTFDAEELSRELEVILEELKRGLDSPSHALGRKIFETIYAGTKASIPIIGYEETIRNFSRESLQAFHDKWYQPTNMKLVAVGHVEAENLLRTVQDTFGKVQGTKVPEPYKPKTQPLKGVHVHIVEGDYEQPRLELAFPAPGLLDEDVLAVDMAAFALGSGESSRLHRRLRDELQLTSVVGCSVYAPQFGGLFELSVMPHDDNYLECVEAVGRELSRIKYSEPVTLEELDRARANAKADRIYSEETVTGLARSLGNALQTPLELVYDLVTEAKMNRLAPFDIQKSFAHWFQEDNCVMACILPKGQTELTEDAIRSAFARGVASFKTEFAEKVQRFKPKSAGVYKEALTPQITILYRQQEHSDMMNVCAIRSGGLRVEPVAQVGTHHILADLIGAATESRSYEEMLRLVEGQGIVLSGFSGKDSFGLKLHCLTEQVADMLPLFAEALISPRFPEVQLQNSKLEVADDIQMEKDHPSSLAMRAFQQALYDGHSYQYPVWGREEVIEELTAEGLLDFHKQQLRDSHWIISGVGRLTFDEFYAQLESLLGPHLKEKVEAPLGLSLAKPDSLEPKTIRLTKAREQVHLVIGTLGLSWNDPDRCALDILSNVLGGSGGHLFLQLRDQQSLAYTVSPIQTHGCHRGMFGVYMACSPQKLAEAVSGIERVWDNLCNQILPQEEIDRARNYLIGGHEADMQRGDSQAMSMGLMELYGLGFDDFDRYANALAEVTAADVQRVAQRLLKAQPRVQVYVGPE